MKLTTIELGTTSWHANVCWPIFIPSKRYCIGAFPSTVISYRFPDFGTHANKLPTPQFSWIKCMNWRVVSNIHNHRILAKILSVTKNILGSTEMAATRRGRHPWIGKICTNGSQNTLYTIQTKWSWYIYIGSPLRRQHYRLKMNSQFLNVLTLTLYFYPYF